jgi:hypothetical protein
VGLVTATEVSHAATPSGFEQAARERRQPIEVVPNEYMVFGSQSEAEIMRHAHQHYGILPNDWLIADARQSRFASTPDGLSPDHKRIAECKTGSKIPKSIPRNHRDQMFWQMATTDAEGGLYLFNQRVPDNSGGFFLGLIEPITFWLDRDDARIAELIKVAYRLLEVDF